VRSSREAADKRAVFIDDIDDERNEAVELLRAVGEAFNTATS